MKPEISIVIVNWNTRQLLRECLESIARQVRGVTYEVLVVDNASSDASAAMVAAEFPTVRLFANTRNLGFAAANNQAMVEALGNYILLLNPDTLLLPGALEKAWEYASAHPRAAVVGCQVLEKPGKIQRTCFRFPSLLNALLESMGLAQLFPHSRLFSRAYLGDWDRRSPRAVDVVSGMFMLVRRSAIEQVGLMDESYFVYAEETDWCYRFHRAGWQCLFTPEAQIIHRDGGGNSTDQQSVRMYVQLHKSLLLFHRKNKGLISWLGVRILYGSSMAIRLAIFQLGAWFKPHLRHRADQARAALLFHLLNRDVAII